MAPTWSERKERGRRGEGERKKRRGERKRACKWCDSIKERKQEPTR